MMMHLSENNLPQCELTRPSLKKLYISIKKPFVQQVYQYHFNNVEPQYN